MSPISLFRNALLAGGFSLLITPTAVGSVWIEANDVELRNSLIVLAESGLIKTPIQQFPITWKSLLPELDALELRKLSAPQQLALRHVRHQLAQAQNGPKTRWYIAATDSEQVVKDYGDDTYEEGKISLSRTLHGTHWAARIQVNYRQDPFEDDNNKTLDGSYLAYNLNDWSFSLDSLPLRWGPAEHSSLLFSNNARPMPKIRIDYAPDYPPAGMNPFKLSFFSAYQDDGYSHYYRIDGIRFSSQLLQHLWFGVSAIQQNADERPDNRMLTADARSGFAWGVHQFSGYLEVGIDRKLEADDKPAYTIGTQWMTGSKERRHSVTVEYSQLDGGDEHNFYTLDENNRPYFLNHQRNPGSPFPRESQTLSASYRQFSADGSAWTALLSHSKAEGDNTFSRALFRRTEPAFSGLIKISLQYLDGHRYDNEVGVQLSGEWRF
ncbi:capsule assembly Wzi family protein [Idiomarina sp. HP20-50]|uniref:capsule assembly Wzi family protein n=1 Tax=Idiomarina sp. HP20-50 TaxID=3070813 RepID=UPI00294AB579|nr:capsule assembly Wzi family protein [Idiomarina sp. HP20-50]MDV6316884.1 capsule assembly Wzi family protein [Idiomarina sp. HP20-50]